MKALFAWLTAVLRWLAEIRSLWLAMTVVAVAVVVSFWPCASETQIRIAGLVLQCLGLATVAVGVHQTRRLFGRPDSFTLLRGWLTRFPRWRRNVSLEASVALSGVSAVGAVGYVWSPVDPSAPLEARLQAVISNVDHLNERLSQLQNDQGDATRKHSEALRHEEQERATAVSEISARLEAAETGGLTSPWSG